MMDIGRMYRRNIVLRNFKVAGRVDVKSVTSVI